MIKAAFLEKCCKGLYIVVVFFTVFLIVACARTKAIPEGVEPRIVRGEIVQANLNLFSPGMFDFPAGIVFSLDPEMSAEDLERFAAFAYSLKNTTQSDPDRQIIARAMTDEVYRPDYFLKVPTSLVGNDETYIAHVWIDREKLSEGYLKADSSLVFQVYVVDGVPYTIRLIGDASP